MRNSFCVLKFELSGELYLQILEHKYIKQHISVFECKLPYVLQSVPPNRPLEDISGFKKT